VSVENSLFNVQYGVTPEEIVTFCIVLAALEGSPGSCGLGLPRFSLLQSDMSIVCEAK
jgi:hypothetical protein